MKRYISDLHFFHEAMNQNMDCRGFAGVEEMTRHMLERWNSRVQKRDEVYILGDLALGKGEPVNELLRALNGRLYMIEGNHDYFLRDKKTDLSRFQWVKSYAEIHDNQRKVILSHYPVFCYNGQNRLTASGNARSYMLYGHVHNTLDELLVNRFIRMTRETRRSVRNRESGEIEERSIPCNMINCFCMFSNYVPLTLDEWIVLDAKRRAELELKDAAQSL